MLKKAAVFAFLAAIMPGCSTREDGPLLPIDFSIYYMRDNGLARAFVYDGDWRSGEWLDSNISSWAWVPQKSLSGSTVSYAYGVRYIVCVRLGVLRMFDCAQVAEGAPTVQISNETNAFSIVGLVDAQQTATTAAGTYVLYTTTPSGGNTSLRAAQVSGTSTSTPSILEVSIPDTTTFMLGTPRNASNVIFYLLQGTTGQLRRAQFGAFPAVTINTMSGADDVTDFLVKNQDKVVYERASGELMKADVTALPPAVLYTPGAGEAVTVKGKVDLGTDSEVFFTSAVAGSPNNLYLRRVMFDAGTVTDFAGPLTYTSLSMDRVAFTAARVVWAHVRDMTSYVRSFDRTTPATNSDLLTGGRTLTADGIYVANDAGTWRILFGEFLGGTYYRVAKTETGSLTNEYTFGIAPGPTDAINHLGSSYYDAALDLPAAGGTARLVFVDGSNLRSRTVNLAALSELGHGVRPVDMAQFVLSTGFRAPTCLVGISGAPAQTDIFFFRADVAGLLLRQTNTSGSEASLSAH